MTNRKAYLAIASLLASPLQLMIGTTANLALKITLCIAVILFVDIVWLWVGVALGRASLSASGERILNVAMGATILVATVKRLSWVCDSASAA